MHYITCSIASFLLFLVLSANSFAATFVEENGVIIGLDNVNVPIFDLDGTLIEQGYWNARFHNTPNNIPPESRFYSMAFSHAASVALTDLFKNDGQFSGTEIDLEHDTSVLGFETSSYSQNSFTTFISAVNIGGIEELYGFSFHNGLSDEDKDFPIESWVLSTDDLVHVTYVSWEPVPVPIPAPALLLLVAVLSLIPVKCHRH